jgi:hypothetical protein
MTTDTTIDDTAVTITSAEEAILLQYESTKRELADRRQQRAEVNESIRQLVAEVARLQRIVRVIDATRITDEQPGE